MRLPKKLAEKIIQAGKVGPAVNLPRGKRRNKYRNVPTVVDGRTFDSRKEAARYVTLRDEQRAGLIQGLQLQVRFVLRVNGEIVCRYVADFVYVRAGVRVVEDVKSSITAKSPVYRLKKKLMKAIHGIEIHET